MKTRYTYNGKTYATERALRAAIWQEERKVFGRSLPSSVTVSEAQGKEESFPALKARKEQEIEKAYRQWTEEDAVLQSSLGFLASAGRSSFMDVQFLILAGKGADGYIDADGIRRSLSCEDLQVLQGEIARAQAFAIASRAALLDELGRADTEEALSSVEAAFSPWDGSTEGEED